jgi:hypothetical protein
VLHVENGDDRAISGLELDLALGCSDDAAESFEQMGRRHPTPAAILDPGLNLVAGGGLCRR